MFLRSRPFTLMLPLFLLGLLTSCKGGRPSAAPSERVKSSTGQSGGISKGDLRNHNRMRSVPGKSFDESFNFQPGLDFYQEATELKDLSGLNGNELCWPTALTHRIMYQRELRKNPFPKLLLSGDLNHDGKVDFLDQIRYFAEPQNCNTQKDSGTSIENALSCTRNYYKDSGYQPWVYIIGAHAEDWPKDAAKKDFVRPVNVSDLRKYLSSDLGVIMLIGWYEEDRKEKTWKWSGGHFFNVYGYDYDESWEEDRILLKIVNPDVDYKKRSASQMFDSIEMSKFVKKPEFNYPAGLSYKLHGLGFGGKSSAFVEDIIVFTLVINN